MKTPNEPFQARLWKIGSSVVFTVPSEMIEFKNTNFIEITAIYNGRKFTYMMTPWKCGGSVVVTMPKQYIDAYNLSKLVKNKDSLEISLKVIDI